MISFKGKSKIIMIIITMLLLFCSSYVFAESYENMDEEQLIELRAELYSEIQKIDTILTEKKVSQSEKSTLSNDDMSIESLFPDENIAIAVRDNLKKLSIADTVTQSELDSISKLYVLEPCKSIEGISRLRKLKYLCIYNFNATTFSEELLLLPYLTQMDIYEFKGAELPDWFTKMVQLEKISFINSKNLISLPNDIGNMTNLTSISLLGCWSFSKLPDSIGMLQKLKRLNCGYTSIEVIPESICNCISLTELNLNGTKISALPKPIIEMKDLQISIQDTNIK